MAVLALLLRGIFIALGAAALNRFGWILYVFGAFLLYTAARLAFGRRPEGEAARDTCGPWQFVAHSPLAIGMVSAATESWSAVGSSKPTSRYVDGMVNMCRWHGDFPCGIQLHAIGFSAPYDRNVHHTTMPGGPVAWPTDRYW